MIDSMTRLLKHSAIFLPLLGLMLGLAAPAEAGVVARINLSNQRMDVFVDGRPRYSWPVSTARRGYRTPTGTFKPQSLKVWHRSTIYSGSPMPHSIFFHGGYAIHGSYETKYLGRAASHGCVRLHPSNAKALYSLVKTHGRGSTVIKITR
jgi:lipoprotein-anchoring transpeptidase ErfK/SrfK